MIPEASILPDDELIALPEVRALMGGMAISTVYDDPDLMAAKVKTGERSVRWIKRVVQDIRAQRVARSQEGADTERAKAENRRERRRAKQRATARARIAEATPTI
jgi:predicted DNA-binding transcriptional regulator AlpA